VTIDHDKWIAGQARNDEDGWDYSNKKGAQSAPLIIGIFIVNKSYLNNAALVQSHFSS